MSSWTPILLLLLVLVAPVVPRGIWIFSGYIYCQLDKPFIYRVKALEQGSGSTQIPLPYFETALMSPDFYNLTYISKLPYYPRETSFSLEVTHNCNSYGHLFTAKYDLGKFNGSHTPQYVSYTLDITNRKGR